MNALRLIALDDTVVFPGMTVTLPAEVGDDSHVFVVPQRDGEPTDIGVVAKVLERVVLPGRGAAVAVTGLHRAVVDGAHTDTEGVVRVDVEERVDAVPTGFEITELEREYRAVVEEIIDVRRADERVREYFRSLQEPGALADASGLSPDLGFEQKRTLLTTLDVHERLAQALLFQRDHLAALLLRKRIRREAESGAHKHQREHLLRQQMDVIRKELGQDGVSVVDEYRAKIVDAGMPDAVREQATQELERFERAGEANAESSLIRSYLDWLLAMPWTKRSAENLDPVHARAVLDDEHEELDDVKRRITEYLAVRKLRSERDIPDDKRSGVILALAGPPGTGKTSIGESIAHATGRAFVRMSLGGVRDEAEIRGHRRTYIGALPGRLVRALRDAGTMNPVIMLDEVDKLGSDWRGDPSAALLEVLDPAQNHSFRDHYLDVELDLSQVLFIATANVIDSIPQPLLDRMEVIRFDGYTDDEKVAIANGHLWPRQVERNGLRPDEVSITDAELHRVIAEYTREAGVRQLERELGTLARKAATAIASADVTAPIVIDTDAIRAGLGRRKFSHEVASRTATPGVATGLAVTGAGGEVLFVEAASMAGSDGLSITGQLGDVMRESAHIALSHVRSHADEIDIPPQALRRRSFHLHVPAGAIPKDGPSAGITMVTALASLLTNRPVRPTVGMTGEVTLQGRVLAVGGVKQKVLAAHAAGIREVVLPEACLGDLDDISADVLDDLQIHPVTTVAEVLDVALGPRCESLAA